MAIRNFLDQLQAISPILPMLVRVLLVTIVALAIWVVISVIAHWIWQALQEPLSRLGEALKAWRKRTYDTAVSRFDSRNKPVNEFVEDYQRTLSFDDDNDHLRSVVGTVRKSLRKLTKGVEHLDETVAGAEEVMVKQGGDLRQTVTSLERAHAEGKQVLPSKRQAALKTVIFTLLCIVFVCVNTLMLSEFFKAVMPPMTMMGIRLSLIAACFFSLVEVSGGAAMAFIDGDRPIATVKRISLLLVILVLGLIEFVFYAKFGENIGLSPFEELLEPGSFGAKAAKMWFGVFGPAIVFVMAWCADMLVTGIRDLAADNVSRILEKIKRTAAKTGAVLDEMGVKFGGKAECAKSIHDAQTDMEAAIQRVQDRHVAESRILDRTEMLKEYANNLFLLVASLAAIAIIMIVYNQYYLAYVTPGSNLLGLNVPMNYYSFSILALFETLLLLAIGYLNTWVGRRVEPGKSGGYCFTRPKLSVLIVNCTLAVAFACLNIFLIFHSMGTPGEFMWDAFRFLLVMVAGYFLYWSGQNLGLMLPAAWTLIQVVIVILFAGLLFVVVGVIAALFFLLTLVQFAIYALAYPYRLLFQRARRTPAPTAS
jgi:ABC-type multidrug transport system fused ATPase/permease subunit